MVSYLADLGPWSWIIAGILLMALELAAPGVFFLWLGLAAVLTGVVDWSFDLTWQSSFLVFAMLAVTAVLLGRMVTRHPGEDWSDAPGLNRRGHALIGRVFTLETAIESGNGRIRVGDSSWQVVGPDAPVGASVRIVRVDGTTLIVEAA